MIFCESSHFTDVFFCAYQFPFFSSPYHSSLSRFNFSTSSRGHFAYQRTQIPDFFTYHQPTFLPYPSTRKIPNRDKLRPKSQKTIINRKIGRQNSFDFFVAENNEWVFDGWIWFQSQKRRESSLVIWKFHRWPCTQRVPDIFRIFLAPSPGYTWTQKVRRLCEISIEISRFQLSPEPTPIHDVTRKKQSRGKFHPKNFSPPKVGRILHSSYLHNISA